MPENDVDYLYQEGEVAEVKLDKLEPELEMNDEKQNVEDTDETSMTKESAHPKNLETCDTLPWHHFEDSQLPDHMESPEAKNMKPTNAAQEKDESAVLIGGEYVELISEEEADEPKAAFQDRFLVSVCRAFAGIKKQTSTSCMMHA